MSGRLQDKQFMFVGKLEFALYSFSIINITN